MSYAAYMYVWSGRLNLERAAHMEAFWTLVASRPRTRSAQDSAQDLHKTWVAISFFVFVLWPLAPRKLRLRKHLRRRRSHQGRASAALATRSSLPAAWPDARDR